MAIDDNTLYGVKGSQVKDFTAKIKNSVGGADKLAHLVYMVPLTINEGNEIAAQIDDPEVYGVVVTQTCVYGFLRVKDGVWLDRLGVGSAISNGYNFVFVNDNVSYNDAATIVKYAANWDDDEEDCYPTFYLCGQTAKTPFGNSRYTRIDLGVNSNTGLSAWYHPTETSWAREPDYVIQRMTSTEATEIANQINEEQGSTVVSSIEVRSAMIFTIRSTTTGKIVKYSTVKNMLSRSTSNIVFLPEIARNTNYEIMERAGGSTSKQSFILRDFYNDTEYEYILKNPSAESSNLQYMWYLFDHEDLREGLIDVFGVDDSTSIASAPDSLFQVAYDSSDNLYMAVGDSSTADWKQINNTIYADTISPATAVDPITASMIAGGASPETLANGSVVEIVGTYAGDDQNYCLKYADGRLIAIIRKTFSNVSFGAWGSCYEHIFGIGWLGYYAVPFKYKPVVNCYATSNISVWACVDASNTENELLDKAPKVEIVRPSTNPSASGAIHLIAYGFWK